MGTKAPSVAAQWGHGRAGASLPAWTVAHIQGHPAKGAGWPSLSRAQSPKHAGFLNAFRWRQEYASSGRSSLEHLL